MINTSFSIVRRHYSTWCKTVIENIITNLDFFIIDFVPEMAYYPGRNRRPVKCYFECFSTQRFVVQANIDLSWWSLSAVRGRCFQQLRRSSEISLDDSLLQLRLVEIETKKRMGRERKPHSDVSHEWGKEKLRKNKGEIFDQLLAQFRKDILVIWSDHGAGLMLDSEGVVEGSDRQIVLNQRRAEYAVHFWCHKWHLHSRRWRIRPISYNIFIYCQYRIPAHLHMTLVASWSATAWTAMKSIAKLEYNEWNCFAYSWRKSRTFIM